MNVLYATAAVVAAITAAVYSQRGDNWRAKAHYWRKAFEVERRHTRRQENRIAGLETALGRRKPGHWLPARHTPPVIETKAPTEAEVHLWLLTTDGEQARYQRYPFAEYQPKDDRVCHRKPKVWSRRITTGEVREIVGVEQ